MRSMIFKGILVRDAMPRKSEHILYIILFYLFIFIFKENYACAAVLSPLNLHMSLK